MVEPKVLLLDEPLKALDLNLRRQMQQELIQIQKQVDITFVYLTHDQEEAMSIADVIAVMNDGQIEDLGQPERVYMKTQSLFTATFMGESNIIEGRVVKPSGNQIDVETPVGRHTIRGCSIRRQGAFINKTGAGRSGPGRPGAKSGAGRAESTENSFFRNSSPLPGATPGIEFADHDSPAAKSSPPGRCRTVVIRSSDDIVFLTR